MRKKERAKMAKHVSGSIVEVTTGDFFWELARLFESVL